MDRTEATARTHARDRFYAGVLGYEKTHSGHTYSQSGSQPRGDYHNPLEFVSSSERGMYLTSWEHGGGYLKQPRAGGGRVTSKLEAGPLHRIGEVQSVSQSIASLGQMGLERKELDGGGPEHIAMEAGLFSQGK